MQLPLPQLSRLGGGRVPVDEAASDGAADAAWLGATRVPWLGPACTAGVRGMVEEGRSTWSARCNADGPLVKVADSETVTRPAGM